MITTNYTWIKENTFIQHLLTKKVYKVRAVSRYQAALIPVSLDAQAVEETFFNSDSHLFQPVEVNDKFEVIKVFPTPDIDMEVAEIEYLRAKVTKQVMDNIAEAFASLPESRFNSFPDKTDPNYRTETKKYSFPVELIVADYFFDNAKF